MAMPIIAVTSEDATATADESLNESWKAEELSVKVPRRRNIAEGFSFDSLTNEQKHTKRT
jgi:hypothetical protein